MRRLPILAALLVFVSACGGGETLTLEEYFDQLEAASVEFSTRSDAADTELTESADPVGDAQRIIPEFVEILGDFVEDLKGISPPDEVAGEHEVAVESGEAALSALREVVGVVEGIEDLTGLGELFEGPEMTAFGAAGERFEANCDALQGIADREGLEVDLRCDT